MKKDESAQKNGECRDTLVPARSWKEHINRIDPFRVNIEKIAETPMRTGATIYVSESLMKKCLEDNSVQQAVNVATLPGILGRSMAMPDIHFGYGFPIGGVAATDMTEGVISPGGVGYDINCGVRLLTTGLKLEDIHNRVQHLVNAIFKNVPSGVGSKGQIKLSERDIRGVLEDGAGWAVRSGYGTETDMHRLEEGGCLKEADSSLVSREAKDRGMGQLGSLGAGNHFLEIQRVDEIFDKDAAKAFGVREVGQIMVMFHTGSRGLGHQVCTDYLKEMQSAVRKYKICLPDRQLACAPVDSQEGIAYYKAMCCAANFGWANRQMITHWVRKSFKDVLGEDFLSKGMDVVYDVAHNIAKKEEHTVDGRLTKVMVHRKGATRAFGPGHKVLPSEYKDYGQPVLIPGDMGTCSYLLVGTEQAMRETFGSTCHGAGRAMSRNEALASFTKESVVKKLNTSGIYIQAATKDGIVEEAQGAYKDVSEVVEVVHGAGISRKVARLVPVGVMKG
ncbi:MAG: RtcB family protein [Thermoplasmata archaeon]